MKLYRILAAAALGASLVACSAAQVQTATSDVQQACVSVSPVLAAGTDSGNPTASQVAAYGNAFCGVVMAGSLPPTANAGSTTWLGTLAGAINTLLPVAVALL